MANTDIILAKMRSARVQPHVFAHSLVSLNQKALAHIIKERRFELGPGGLVNYLLLGTRSKAVTASLVSLVTAKELVLSGCKVFCTSVSEIVLRGEQEEIIERMGNGYWVVSDLSENTANCTPFQWDALQALLLSHLGRGGGLVIGSAHIEAVNFGDDFTGALAAFETINVM